MQTFISWAITIQAVLLLVGTTLNGHFPTAWNSYPLVAACLLIWGAWWYNSHASVYDRELHQISISPFALWPISQAMIWTSFFGFLKYSGAPGEDIIFVSEGPWWLDNWVYTAVLMAIILGGFVVNFTVQNKR